MGAEHAGSTQSLEKYRFLDPVRFPLGQDTEFVYSLLARTAHTLPSSSIRLLAGCRTFATLEAHAGRLCQELSLGLAAREPILQQLAGWAEAGLLVAHAELTERCLRGSDPHDVPPRIGTVGIPTRARTSSLRRCLLSYLENFQKHGRSADFVVVDDSESPAVRADNQRLLEELRSRTGADLYYAGPEEKARFADLLAGMGLPADAVRFGLTNDDGYNITTGCNRNALLLHTAGELFLQVDDDTVCQLAPVPAGSAGLAFSSRFDPTEFWFFAEDRPVLSSVNFADQDLLALHEQLLGQRLGNCLAALPAYTDLDLDQTSPGFFRKGESAGRVVVTALGVVGASGMSSSVHFLSLEGASRVRLLASEPTYRSALQNHQVLRGVTRPTICDKAHCMALNLGLDHRSFLPPFLPVQRNQDGVFASLVSACRGDGFFGFLPCAVFHDPPERRARVEDPARSVAALRTGQIIQALVGALGPGLDQANSARSLERIGSILTEWGSLPLADFEEVVRLQLSMHMSQLACRWENQLRAFGGQPDFWAKDVAGLLSGLRQALPSASFVRAADLGEAFGGEEGRLRLPQLVCRFGQFLQCWPGMVEAARDLRSRGVRLAVPVR